MSGTLVGGWEFVWAAYGLTTMVLGIYTLSVLTRYRAAKARDAGEEISRSEGKQ